MFARLDLFKSFFGYQPDSQPTCSFASRPANLYTFVSTVVADVRSYFNQVIPEGQSLVNANLAEFLRLTAPDTTKGLSDAIDKHGGFCFGLSICHGLMDLVGKQEWWEASLFTVATWDKTQASLDKEIVLPGSEDKTPLPLRALMKRVLNYVVFYQFICGFEFRPHGVGHGLVAIKYLIEILINSNILKAQDVSVAAGFFTEERLLVLLDAELIKDSLCLVGDMGHVIRVGYRDNH